MYSLYFYLPGPVFISLDILKSNVAQHRSFGWWWGVPRFLSALWIFISLPSGLHGFLWEVSCYSYWGSLYMMSLFSLAFKILSLPLAFNRIITLYPGVYFFKLTILRLSWASWRCKLMFLINYGKFNHHFFLLYIIYSYYQIADLKSIY